MTLRADLHRESQANPFLLGVEENEGHFDLGAKPSSLAQPPSHEALAHPREVWQGLVAPSGAALMQKADWTRLS